MSRSTERMLIIIAIFFLGFITLMGVLRDGPTGILPAITGSWWSFQIYIDLVIGMILFLFWMWPNAKATGRNPWPWLVVTLFFGSFGPLFYLLLRKDSAS